MWELGSWNLYGDWMINKRGWALFENWVHELCEGRLESCPTIINPVWPGYVTCKEVKGTYQKCAPGINPLSYKNGLKSVWIRMLMYKQFFEHIGKLSFSNTLCISLNLFQTVILKYTVSVNSICVTHFIATKFAYITQVVTNRRIILVLKMLYF